MNGITKYVGFVSGVFHLAYVFKGYACYTMYQYFIHICMNNIPLSGSTTFCLSIHQVLDIWVVSN